MKFSREKNKALVFHFPHCHNFIQIPPFCPASSFHRANESPAQKIKPPEKYQKEDIITFFFHMQGPKGHQVKHPSSKFLSLLPIFGVRIQKSRALILTLADEEWIPRVVNFTLSTIWPSQFPNNSFQNLKFLALKSLDNFQNDLCLVFPVLVNYHF